MADWGLLAGLGEAAKGFGNAWSDRAKSDLAERLAKEREERAEQRAIAREERQRKQEESTPASHKIERDSDGATWRVPYNKFGQPLGERVLASAQDIKDYNYEDEKRRVSLDNLVGQGKRAQEMHEAILGYKKAATETQEARAETYLNPRPRPSTGRGGSSRTSLDEVDGPVNDSDVIQAMINENRNLFKANKLADDEAYRVVAEVLKAANSTGRDPIDLLHQTLPRYKDRRNSRKGPAKKSGGLNLGN